MRIIKRLLDVRAKGLAPAGAHNLGALVAAGSVDKTSAWSFTAEDGDKLLGADGGDWANYAKWFLGEDAAEPADTKTRYKYPFGKDGKVFRSALVAIRSRAAQNDQTQVFDAAGHYLDEIDGTKNYTGKAALPMVQRAYAKFEMKALQESDTEYTLTGIASTPTPDRMQDVVEAAGAEYDLPIPLLWQHDNCSPIGLVVAAKVTPRGIAVTCTIPKLDVEGNLKARLDEAVQSIQLRIVRGFSIGFCPIEYSYMEDTGGYRFIKWMWYELSVVTIPANAEATIQSIKSFDAKLPAPSGTGLKRVKPPAVVSASKKQQEKSVKISEQIKSLMAARAAKVAQMETVQQKAADADRNKDGAEQEEFDTVSDEIEAIDRELKDMRRLEKLQVVKAVKVATAATGEPEEEVDPEAGAEAQVSGITKHARTMVVTQKPVEKGIMFARFVKCLGAAKGDMSVAVQLAGNFYKDTPQIGRVIKAMRDQGLTSMESVLKATISGGTTTDATWAGPLLEYTQFAGDFVDFLRPQTIIGKFGVGGIPALRSVPFNVHIRGATSGGTGYWVGQGAAKPLTKFDYEDIYLGWNKAATIAVLTEELMRFSSPSAEALVRDGLAGAIIERLDIDFVDPTKAAVSNVSPASITNGVTPIASAGATAADVRADIAAAMTVFIQNNISPTTAVWIMPATVALSLSLLRNAFGQPEFPNITMNGGTLEGVPVITSQYVPHSTSGALIILANASDIWLSDDGQVTIDASREASLQMLDNPTNASSNGTATTVVSMFQTNSVALRAERFINWKKRRANAVVTVDNVAYTGG